MKNLRKDIQRGTMNRVAENASVLGEGNSPADHSHVSRTTPFQTKRKEIMSEPQYQADTIDPAREKLTSAKRHAKDVRPL